MLSSIKTFFKKLADYLYIFLYIYFVFDCIFMSDGHYFELFNIFGTPITPRLLLFGLLVLFFLLRFIFIRNVRIIPQLIPFFFLFLFCSLSFVLGMVANGFSRSWLDYRSVMLLLVVFPTVDIFDSKLLKIKRIYFCISLIAILVSLFIISVYIYQLINNYTYSYMTWIFGKTQNPLSSFMNLSFRQGFGVFHDSLFYITILISCNICILWFGKTKRIINKILLIMATVVMAGAVVQSVTKGFIFYIVAVIIGCACYTVFRIIRQRISESKRLFSASSIIITISVTCIGILLIIIISRFINFERLFDFSNDSTQIRLVFIKESFEQIVKPPIFIGKFYGFHLESKGEIHLEISLLEVLLKQGVLGLYLWLVPLFIVFRLIKNNTYLSKVSKMVLYTCILSVYVISMFNPHLCSISGILVISLTISGVRTLSFEPRSKKSIITIVSFSKNQIRLINNDSVVIKTLPKPTCLRNIVYELNKIGTTEILFVNTHNHVLVNELLSLNLEPFSLYLDSNSYRGFYSFLSKFGLQTKRLNDGISYIFVSMGTIHLLDKRFMRFIVEDVSFVVNALLSSGVRSPYIRKNNFEEHNNASPFKTYTPQHLSYYCLNLFYNISMFIRSVKTIGLKKAFLLIFKTPLIYTKKMKV